MDAEQLNKALYEKMSAEQERYRHNLLGQTPEEILNHVFEYSAREDILMEISAQALPAPLAEALLKSPFPLADIYKDFRNTETNQMEVVADCIKERATKLLEAQREVKQSQKEMDIAQELQEQTEERPAPKSQLEKSEGEIDGDEYDVVELFGTTALFFNERVRREDVPEGLYCYDLRGSDDDPGDPVSVERYVRVNHAGTILTAKPLEIPAQGHLTLGDELNFIGTAMTINEFKDEYARPEQVQARASGQRSQMAAGKPSIRDQLAAAKAAQAEKPAAQQRQKDKEAR